MRRNKRKAQRVEERSGGNVIPLPRGRADLPAAQEVRGPVREAATAEQLEPQPARASRSAEQLATHADIHHDDDHPEIRNFFASATKSAPPASGQWTDLEGGEHDAPPTHPAPRAMYWTAGIGGAGLLLIGAFLLYHKVLMPTPEELTGKGQVALPTPDMVKSDADRVGEAPAASETARSGDRGGAGAAPGAASVPTLEPPAGPGSAPSSEAPASPAAGPVPSDGAGAAPATAEAAAPPATAASPGAASANAPGTAAPPNTAAPTGSAPPSTTPSGAPARASTASAPRPVASAGAGGGAAPAAPSPRANTPPSPSGRAPAAASAPSAPASKATAGNYAEALAEARKLGYRRSAEAAYLRAIEANPKGVEALSGLAMLYLNFGDNVRAKQRAEQAVARDASSAEGWIVLGAAQGALGKANEARQAYQRCAALPAGKYVSECKRMLR